MRRTRGSGGAARRGDDRVHRRGRDAARADGGDGVGGLRPVRALVSASLLLTVSGEAGAQAIAWDDDRWRIEAGESSVERHQGRESLRLANGTAWLDGLELRNGTISFELFASEDLGFHGVAFRAVDDGNYEHFYLRPFVSGNPDATQYTPVFNGVSGWQIYSGPRFGLPVYVDTDEWVHVELRVQDRVAEVLIDGELLVFPALQRSPVAGRIGLTSGGAPVRFANLRIDPSGPRMSGGGGAPAADAPPGVFSRWRVSTPFPEANLDGLFALENLAPGELVWNEAEPSFRGIVNLASLHTLDETDNTVFAVVTLEASRPHPVLLRFGFSDRVRVYLNGRLLYRGRAEWRSRDYKFLGTVGLFDEVVLPLGPGENELRFAVSENFGGWAITAALIDGDDVRVMAGMGSE